MDKNNTFSNNRTSVRATMASVQNAQKEQYAELGLKFSEQNFLAEECQKMTALQDKLGTTKLDELYKPVIADLDARMPEMSQKVKGILKNPLNSDFAKHAMVKVGVVQKALAGIKRDLGMGLENNNQTMGNAFRPTGPAI